MSQLNISENFAGRVNYAAQVITNRRNTSRSFDNCFENYDGDVVVAALVRRAEKNVRLRENLPIYLGVESLAKMEAKFRGKNLKEASRQMIAASKAEHAAWMASRISQAVTA